MDVIDGAFRRRAAVRSRCRRDPAATAAATAATVTAGVISAADDADTANGAE